MKDFLLSIATIKENHPKKNYTFNQLPNRRDLMLFCLLLSESKVISSDSDQNLIQLVEEIRCFLQTMQQDIAMKDMIRIEIEVMAVVRVNKNSLDNVHCEIKINDQEWKFGPFKSSIRNNRKFIVSWNDTIKIYLWKKKGPFGKIKQLGNDVFSISAMNSLNENSSKEVWCTFEPSGKDQIKVKLKLSVQMS